MVHHLRQVLLGSLWDGTDILSEYMKKVKEVL
jgi:hypothetical protein